MGISVSNNKKGGEFKDINITPLTDIFLVLVIIMMVVAPSFQTIGQDVDLPAINSGYNIDDDEVTVFVTRDSQYFVNSAYTEESELAKALGSLIDLAPNKKVVVKADSQAKTREIMTVMRAARDAGFERLTVAGEPLSENQQRELEEGRVITN